MRHVQTLITPHKREFLQVDHKFEKFTFGSRSEAACCLLLEKYTPYKAETGKTFQIPVGNCMIDFYVGTKFVEYHPTVLMYDFSSQDAYNYFLETLRQCPKSAQECLKQVFEHEASHNYYKRRRYLLDASEKYKSNPLVVLKTPGDVARMVREYAFNSCPAVDKLIGEFNHIRDNL